MAEDSPTLRSACRPWDGPGSTVLLFFAFWMVIIGCATPDAPRTQAPALTDEHRTTEQLLRSEVRSWLGTPHRMGGMTRRGVDCSGLVVVLYDKLFSLKLPRTTSALMHAGQRVPRSQLAAGDLVFFKPGKKYRHVGIYLGQGDFAHTSTSRGVMISSVEEAFWKGCYLTGRRVL